METSQRILGNLNRCLEHFKEQLNSPVPSNPPNINLSATKLCINCKKPSRDKITNVSCEEMEKNCIHARPLKAVKAFHRQAWEIIPWKLQHHYEVSAKLVILLKNFCEGKKYQVLQRVLQRSEDWIYSSLLLTDSLKE